MLRHLESLWRTRSRVRKLFAIVVMAAACLLLLQVYYLRSPCLQGGRCESTDEQQHLEVFLPVRKAQESRPHPQKTKITQGNDKVFHVLKDVPLQNHTTVTKAPREKWIIVDVTSKRCKGQVRAPPAWNVLLVSRAKNDNSTELATLPPNLDRVRDVKTDTQQVWEKNDALVLAIVQGATQILETNCSVPSSEILQRMQFQDQKDYGLMYNDTLLFNPYAHFGAWALAPRAAALHLRPRNNSRMYYVRDFKTVLIKRAVSDQTADAVRVVLPAKQKRGEGVRFDPSSPPVYLGHRTFTPALPVCSVYRREAFWALVDPCSPPSLRCHALRLFIQQRLLRELDSFSGYYQLGRPSRQFAVSKEKETIHPAGDETLMDVVKFLDAWKCDEGLRFHQCFASLGDDLRENGYLTLSQNQRIQQFLLALEVLGAVEPDRVETPWRGARKMGEFRVQLGSVRATLESGGEAKEKFLWSHLVEHVEHRCKGSATGGYFAPVRQWKNPAIEDVVLIVSFNKNSYVWRNLAFLETTYRPYFKHIAYCVTDVDSLLSEDLIGLLEHMIVVEGLTTYWYLMYGCTTVLMQMRLQGVRGYLQIGDDTLLNPWNLFNRSHDVIFLHDHGMTIDAHHHHVRPHWKWWIGPQGRCPLLNVMTELEEISGVSKRQLLTWAGASADTPFKKRRHTFSEIREGDKKGRPPPVTHCDTLPGTEVWAKPSKKQAERFLFNYYHTHNMSGHFRGKTQDFFYIPQTLAEDYVPMSHLFMRNQVIVELALHAIQMGIAGPSDIQVIQGSSLWHENRNIQDAFFNVSHFYLHPFKNSLYTHKRPHQRSFYCDVYLRTLIAWLKNRRP